ncbi:hypothetical protein [Massilia sp. DD77]|uniref:hypothetical protein n=1 Tax=Massilia sp. DD77 TaxID=3109349 RepID=UPI002FFDE754
MSLLTMIAPALVPALSDGLRGLIAKFTGSAGAQPQNVGEAIQLMEAQTRRVQALAELDKLPDGAAQWVVNLRGAFRYVVCGGVVAATVAGTYAGVDPIFLALLYDLSGASMSFIIGERMYIKLRGAAK